MTIKALQESFAKWSAQNVPLVLASVFETEGSTYSKAGARMLITGDGRFQGMLSGGCLEGDLALRAQDVLDSGTPQTVTYDLGKHDDELWGLGVGCDGLMRIFLQPLMKEREYEPFTAMVDVLTGDRPGTALTVLKSTKLGHPSKSGHPSESTRSAESGHPSAAAKSGHPSAAGNRDTHQQSAGSAANSAVANPGHPSDPAEVTANSGHPSIESGATQVAVGEDIRTFGIPAKYHDVLRREAKSALTEKRSFTRSVEVGDSTLEILVARLVPPPRILVLGAGLDAEPIVRLAGELGWRVTVQDHRPTYIDNGNFAAAEQVLCEPAILVSERLILDRYAAVIVMSHHLDTDRTYLAQLSATDIPYIGLLGPRNRRDRLLEELGTSAANLEHRLHGPAGLDIGADGPASIALAILAEMQNELKE